MIAKLPSIVVWKASSSLAMRWAASMLSASTCPVEPIFGPSSKMFASPAIRRI